MYIVSVELHESNRVGSGVFSFDLTLQQAHVQVLAQRQAQAQAQEHGPSHNASPASATGRFMRY